MFLYVMHQQVLIGKRQSKFFCPKMMFLEFFIQFHAKLPKYEQKLRHAEI